MKIKAAFFGILLLTSAILLTPDLAFGQISCERAFVQPKSRGELKEFLIKAKVPAVQLPTANGDIPVVLMNSETGPIMAKFLSESLGTIVAHQPDWKNDHGMLRLGDILSDMDTPGARNRGELHNTGISWVSTQAYLKRGGSYKRIEVAYALTRRELLTAMLYALMRRAAIVRAKFTFAGATQDTHAPNLLSSGGEHCFIYCSGSALSAQIYEIKSRFLETGLGPLDEFLQKSDVQRWLFNVKKALIVADRNSADELSWNIPFNTGPIPSLANNPVFTAMSEQQQKETVNWIVAGNFSMDYLQLVNKLGLGNTGNGFAGMQNSRATAVLVYDSQVSAENFVSQNYQSPGIFSTWTHAEAKPLTR